MSRSLIFAGIGWMALSGTGLVVGGTQGGLILGFASQALVFYGLWQAQQKRRRQDNTDDADDGGA